MVRVTGPDVELELVPPLLLHAVASTAATATPATRIHRLTAFSLRRHSACESLRSRPPDDRLNEPAVGCRRCAQEVQVAPLGRLQHVVAVQGRPAPQVRRGGRCPRGPAPGELALRPLQAGPAPPRADADPV